MPKRLPLSPPPLWRRATANVSMGVLPAVQTGGLCQNKRGCLTVSGVTARPQMPHAAILQGLKTTWKHDVWP